MIRTTLEGIAVAAAVLLLGIVVIAKLTWLIVWNIPEIYRSLRR